MRQPKSFAPSSQQSSRLEAWWWNCAAAVLPLVLWLLVHLFKEDVKATAVEASKELLFFTLTICTLSLADLRRVGMRQHESVAQWFTFGTVTSAAFYGMFLFDSGANRVFERNVLIFAVFLAGAFLAVGIRTQVVLAREGDDAVTH